MRISVRSAALAAATALAVAACGGSDRRMNDTPPANTPPTLSAIADQSISQDTSTQALSFGISDGETTAGSLVVTAASSDTSLIPEGGLMLAGSNATRTVTITPAEGAVGSATVALTVADSAGLSVTRSFRVTVNPILVSFTQYASATFAAGEASDVRSLKGFTLDSDADDDPNAFDALLR